jgi:hypothetical protein
MKHYGIDIAEGSTIINITVPSGTIFPANDNVGEFFFKTDEDLLYIRNNSTWIALSTGSSTNALTLQDEAGSYYLDLANHTGILDGGTF